MDGLDECFGKGYSGDKGDSIVARVIGMVTVMAIAKVTAVLVEDRAVLVKFENFFEKNLKWLY